MAGIIGALLLVLIAVAVVGLVLTQWLPATLAADESTFVRTSATQLALLGSNVDSEIATNGTNPLATTLPLASASVPVVSSPTVASVEYVPDLSGTFASVSASAPGFARTVNVTTGALALSIPNRYTTSASFDFEDGAIWQFAGGSRYATTVFGPLVELAPAAGGWNVSVRLVRFTGPSFGAAGPNPVVVTSALASEQTTTWSAGGSGSFNVTIEIGTYHPCAWYAFFEAVVGQAKLSPALSSLAPANACALLSTGPTIVVLILHNGSSVRVETASIALGLGGQ